jgi:hypothetical protein
MRERTHRANVPKSAVRGTVKKVFARQKGSVGLLVLTDVPSGARWQKAFSMRVAIGTPRGRSRNGSSACALAESRWWRHGRSTDLRRTISRFRIADDDLEIVECLYRDAIEPLRAGTSHRCRLAD